jgi:hypothetical protein
LFDSDDDSTIGLEECDKLIDQIRQRGREIAVQSDRELFRMCCERERDKLASTTATTTTTTTTSAVDSDVDSNATVDFDEFCERQSEREMS